MMMELIRKVKLMLCVQSIFGFIGIKEASGNDDGDSQSDVPSDGFIENDSGEAHCDNGFDKEGVGSRRSACIFDCFHETEVTESRDDEADVDEDRQGIRTGDIL